MKKHKIEYDADKLRELVLHISRQSEGDPCVEFAVGIASPGSFAKVYDADNNTLGFQDIPRAVDMAAAGLEGVVAYTVLPDTDVGPCIDIDLPRGLEGEPLAHDHSIT